MIQCCEPIFFQCYSTALLLSTVGWYRLKVSKFQKQIFLFPFEPKNKQNYISALDSKMSQIKKKEGTLFYQLGGI